MHSSGFTGVQRVHSSLKVSDPTKVQNMACFLVSVSSLAAYRLIDNYWSKRQLHESQSSLLKSNISIWLEVAILVTSCCDLTIILDRCYQHHGASLSTCIFLTHACSYDTIYQLQCIFSYAGSKSVYAWRSDM